MHKWLGILVVAVSGLAGAEPLLDFPDNLAFKREAVESFAERAYRRNLESLAKDGRLDRDPELRARLDPILLRLIEAAGLERPGAERTPWELHTCRQCGETASAMAGGKLLIGEEFVTDLALTDDEMAFVLAHEIGHVLAEHTREFATVARYFLDQGLRREYWDIQRELDNSFNAQVRLAFVAAQQEQEADYIGFILGARAGFEPEAMPSLLTKLGVDKPSPGFGTHPSGEQRLARAIAMLPSARILHAARYPEP